MSAAFRKALSFRGETWTPTPEPERPRGADLGRSVEATRRRRERKLRNVWADQPARAVEPARAEPSAPPDFAIRLPDSCSWGVDGRYARWLLPTHSGKDGLSYREVMEIQLTAKRRRENEQDA